MKKYLEQNSSDDDQIEEQDNLQKYQEKYEEKILDMCLDIQNEILNYSKINGLPMNEYLDIKNLQNYVFWLLNRV